jgi:hypothetical protein
VIRVTAVPRARDGLATPSPGFLATVGRHLDRHRLLTDRVEVVGPTDVGVGVDVAVRIVPGYSPEGRRRAVADALDAFLDPLRGFEGDGWPFGRPVYRSELYAAVEGVSGVDWVVDLGVRADGEASLDAEGNLVLDDSALVHPTDHRVTIRTDLPGGEP